MNVFDLAAKISLDSSEYTSGLNDSKQQTDSFASKLKSGLGTAAKVGGAAIGAIATTAVAAGKVLFGQASATAKYGDTVDKMSQKIGLSAEAYQKWDYVMNLAGADISGLQRGMKTLSNVITDAANGSDQAEWKLRAVGLSIKDLNGLSQEEQLELVISALQGMESGADRTAAAYDLLSQAALEMAPLLNMTAEETQAAMQEAKDYGMVMSDTAVKDAAAFQDSLTKLSGTFNGLKNSIFGEFMPGITAIIGGLSDLIAGNDEASAKLTDGLNKILSNIIAKIPEILAIFENVFNVLVDTIMTNLPMITKSATNIILAIAKGIIKQLPTIVQAAIDIITELINGITDALPQLIDCVLQVFELLVEVLTSEENLTKLLNAAITLILALANGIIQAIPRIIAVLPTLINNILAFLMQAIPLIIDAGVTLLTSLVAALPEIIDSIVAVLPSLIDSIVDGLLAHLDEIIDAGIILFTAIITNVPKIVLIIAQKIPEIIAKVVKAFINEVPKMWEVGKQMLAGIWEGIKQHAVQFWENMKGWLSDVWEGVKNFFGIHSPSKEMAWIGEMLVDGLSMSIDKNGDEAVDSAIKLSEDVNNALNGIGKDIDVTFDSAKFGSTNSLNQPMYEDGYNYSGRALNGQERNITVILEVDKTQLGRVVYNLNREETQRVGVRLSNV